MAKKKQKKTKKRPAIESNPSVKTCNVCNAHFIGKNLTEMFDKGTCPACTGDTDKSKIINRRRKIKCARCQRLFVFELEKYINKFLLPFDIEPSEYFEDKYIHLRDCCGKMVCKQCRKFLFSKVNKNQQTSSITRTAGRGTLGCSDHFEDWWS